MVEYWMDVRKDSLPQVKILGNAFLQDDRSNKVGVRMDENIPSGTVKGYIIRPDEVMATVTGSKSGKNAWIILPNAAYDKVGKIYVTVKIESSSQVATLGCFEGNVYRSTSATTVTA